MKKQTLKVPHFTSISEWTAKEVNYEQFLDSTLRGLDCMPNLIAAMKKIDYAGWEKFFNDISKHVENNEGLSEFVRFDDKGKKGISIGEPNFLIIAVYVIYASASFAAGFAAGTACYKLGPCNLVQ